MQYPAGCPLQLLHFTCCVIEVSQGSVIPSVNCVLVAPCLAAWQSIHFGANTVCCVTALVAWSVHGESQAQAVYSLNLKQVCTVCIVLLLLCM